MQGDKINGRGVRQDRGRKKGIIDTRRAG